MRQFHFIFFLIACLLFDSRVDAQQSASTNRIARLQEQLSSFVSQSRFTNAQWGIEVVSLDSGQTIFEHDANRLMIPASNTKLFTAALALEKLGPEYRITTSCYSTAKPTANGTLDGDLIIYGRGDPTFSDRFNGKGHELDPLVNAIVATGIKRIEGDLVADDSYFHTSSRHGDGWPKADFHRGYSTSFSAIMAHDNVIGFTLTPGKQPGAPCHLEANTNFFTFYNQVLTGKLKTAPSVIQSFSEKQPVVTLTGSLPVNGAPFDNAVAMPNPVLCAMVELKNALARRGITVTGKARVQESSPSETNRIELATVQSRPMKEIVHETMKASQNLYAQILLLEVGAASRGTNFVASAEECGVAEMKKFISQVGIQPGTVLLKEGAGLSHGSQITPQSMITLLTYMSRHRDAMLYKNSLPIAGVDGTLETRFNHTEVEKRLRAKTGTLQGVSALSGYLVTRNNENWVISVMLNHYSGKKTTARDESDAFVRLLVKFSGK